MKDIEKYDPNFQERSDKEIAQAIFPLALILFTTVVGPLIMLTIKNTTSVHCNFETKCFIELLMILFAIASLPTGFSDKFVYWCTVPCIMSGIGLLLQLKLSFIPILVVEIIVFLCLFVFYKEKLA